MLFKDCQIVKKITVVMTSRVLFSKIVEDLKMATGTIGEGTIGGLFEDIPFRLP